MKKKYVCQHCDLCFEDESTIDQFGWHVTCPKCGGSFDTDEFDKRYVIALADDTDFDEWDNYPNEFDDEKVYQIYAFPTPKKLMEFHNKICRDEKTMEKIHSMWYWVVDAYHSDDRTGCAGYVKTILSGAIDYDDPESLKEYFEEV